MKYNLSLLIVILFLSTGFSQKNVGIGTLTPDQKLSVNGKISIGDDVNMPTDGAVKWDGSDFWGYDGSEWLSLTYDGLGDQVVPYNAANPDTAYMSYSSSALSDTSGVIYDSGGPLGDYDSNENLTYKIHSGSYLFTRVIIVELDTEENFDILTISDENQSFQFSGSSVIPDTLFFDANQLVTFTFTSNSPNGESYAGYKIEWSRVGAPLDFEEVPNLTGFYFNPAKVAIGGGANIDDSWGTDNLGRNSINFGFGAMAQGKRSITLGNYARTDFNEGIAIGQSSEALGESPIAIGRFAKATQPSSVAIGDNAKALGYHSISIGRYASTDDNESGISIGSDAYIQGWRSVGLGYGTSNIEDYGVALGGSARVDGAYGIALGGKAVSLVGASIAIGKEAFTLLNEGIAIGSISKANGLQSIAVGSNSITDGPTSIAIGNMASTGVNATNGISMGNGAMTLESGNIAIGKNAKADNLNSISIGWNSNADSTQSVSVGGFSKAQGYKSTAVGDNASAQGSESIALGSAAFAEEDHSVALGKNSKAKEKAIAIGNSSNGFGFGSISIGDDSGATGLGAIAIGNSSKGLGYGSISIGDDSGTTKSGSIAIGNGAKTLYSNSVVIGEDASVSDNFSIAIGGRSGFFDPTESGAYAIGIGNGAKAYREGVSIGYESNSGAEGTAVGYDSFADSLSVACGYKSNCQGRNSITLGNDSHIFGDTSIAIGYNTDVDGFNSIAIGGGVTINSNNYIRIGNDNITTIGGAVEWSIVSDGRFKVNVAENVPGLSFINKLRPVTYNLDKGKKAQHTGGRGSGLTRIQTGFIAQEVEQAAIDTQYDFSAVHTPQNEKDHYTLSYAQFVVPLVQAVQELSDENTNLKDQVNSFKAELLALKSMVQNLESKL